LVGFVTAAQTGNLPGGEKSLLPLLPKEELVHLSTKYSEWAPEPYSQLPGPQTAFGNVGVESPAPMIRMMHLVSGLDNILNAALKPTPHPDKIERSGLLLQYKVSKAFIKVLPWRLNYAQ